MHIFSTKKGATFTRVLAYSVLRKRNRSASPFSNAIVTSRALRLESRACVRGRKPAFVKVMALALLSSYGIGPVPKANPMTADGQGGGALKTIPAGFGTSLH